MMMQKQQTSRGVGPVVAWTALSVLAVLADRGLKMTARATGERAPAGWFDFTLYHNTGIAFSLPLGGTLYWVFAAACAAALLLLLARALGLAGEPRRRDPLRAAMLGCVLLGAASNLYDRAVYGAVIDYIALFRVGFWNIADFMILLGLAALWLRSGSAPKREEPEA